MSHTMSALHACVRCAAAALALAFIAACGSSATSSPDSAASLSSNGQGRAIIVRNETSDSVWPSDPITIDAATIAGDTLVANVSHGGGCSPHSYGLLVSTMWMESNPVQVRARISHDAHGDNCKALLRRELRMSLLPLAAAYREAYRQEHASVIIRLTGSSASLAYKF